jgi:hypothetical protein
VLADAGDGDRLAPLADELAARFPDRPDARYYRATALFLRSRTEDAVTVSRQLVDRQLVDSHPAHARAQNLLGAACATLGRTDCARAAFEASIRGEPARGVDIHESRRAAAKPATRDRRQNRSPRRSRSIRSPHRHTTGLRRRAQRSAQIHDSVFTSKDPYDCSPALGRFTVERAPSKSLTVGHTYCSRPGGGAS